MHEPIADAARSILDGHVVLSRRLATAGHFPTIDVLESVSRVAGAVTTPRAAGRRDHAAPAAGRPPRGTRPGRDRRLRRRHQPRRRPRAALCPQIDAFLRQDMDDTHRRRPTTWARLPGAGGRMTRATRTSGMRAARACAASASRTAGSASPGRRRGATAARACDADRPRLADARRRTRRAPSPAPAARPRRVAAAVAAVATAARDRRRPGRRPSPRRTRAWQLRPHPAPRRRAAASSGAPRPTRRARRGRASEVDDLPARWRARGSAGDVAMSVADVTARIPQIQAQLAMLPAATAPARPARSPTRCPHAGPATTSASSGRHTRHGRSGGSVRGDAVVTVPADSSACPTCGAAPTRARARLLRAGAGVYSTSASTCRGCPPTRPAPARRWRAWPRPSPATSSPGTTRAATSGDHIAIYIGNGEDDRGAPPRWRGAGDAGDDAARHIRRILTDPRPRPSGGRRRSPARPRRPHPIAGRPSRHRSGAGRHSPTCSSAPAPPTASTRPCWRRWPAGVGLRPSCASAPPAPRG